MRTPTSATSPQQLWAQFAALFQECGILNGTCSKSCLASSSRALSSRVPKGRASIIWAAFSGVEAENTERVTAAPLAIWAACQKLAPRSGLSIFWLMTCFPIAFVQVYSGALGRRSATHGISSLSASSSRSCLPIAKCHTTATG
jgi:hypothetical protein